MSKYFYVLPIVVATLGGCSSNSNEIENFIKNPGVNAGRIEPLPKIKLFPIAKYNRDSLSDPFSVRSLSVASGQNAPDKDRQHELLEKFGLESLAMVGFLSQGKLAYALVKDPEGAIHRVQVGNYIGMNYGRIKSITKDGIELVENIADNSGGWSTREASLQYNEQEQLKASGLSSKSGSAK